jgi:hypothetical protein
VELCSCFGDSAFVLGLIARQDEQKGEEPNTTIRTTVISKLQLAHLNHVLVRIAAERATRDTSSLNTTERDGPGRRRGRQRTERGGAGLTWI